MAWSIGASGDTVEATVAALDENSRVQLAWWERNAGIDAAHRADPSRPRTTPGGAHTDPVGEMFNGVAIDPPQTYGRAHHEQVLSAPEQEQAQVEVAVDIAKAALESGVVKGPYHVSLSGHASADGRSPAVLTVSVSQMV